MAKLIKSTCGNCHRKLFRTTDGAWYHQRSGSVSCYPGRGSWKRAIPASY